jgi:proteic killer suppression protein
MRKEWGNDVAKALGRRIKDMEATTSPDGLLVLPGRWEWLKGDRAGQMSARLTPNWRLIARPSDEGTIEIVTVEDYH